MHSLNLGFVWGVKLIKSEIDDLMNGPKAEKLKENLIPIGNNCEQGAIYGCWVKKYSNVGKLKNEILGLDELRYNLVPNFKEQEFYLDNLIDIIPESWGLRIPDTYFVSFWS